MSALIPSSTRRATPQCVRGTAVHWARTLMEKATAPLAIEHLRFQAGRSMAASLHCVLIDCSASMLSGRRLAQAKGFVMQLIQSAYEQQADIAIVTFAANQAEVILRPTPAKPQTSRSVTAWLKPIRGGGGTPLLKGVAAGEKLLAESKRLKPLQTRWLWLLSDGRSRDTPPIPALAAMRVVVDCERQRVALRRCRLIAERWNAKYLALEELEHEPG